ncbi:VPEID-CTERM sorting domain-containing protein [Roseitranquillus sediminis]|uniref:VPEID-CTERM sorting domain-containing protein n=1 Tax=Roseitranquillus sediminis TaxID=2809051 RepID=UPI001D0CAA9E|nr:VPEID-CTERM sorting domain-containing protein [Roseitranquillus sediminis]MBM9593614.1 VPEID-CTERM sorting domain-containing protein [Roseitranquillus sediminis]
MKRISSGLFWALAATALFISTDAALAQDRGSIWGRIRDRIEDRREERRDLIEDWIERRNGGEVLNAPEIDAAHGLAALAVIGGGLALAWERRKRRT